MEAQQLTLLPDPEPSEAQKDRISNLTELTARCGVALTWLVKEVAICKNVFPEGHKAREHKLEERRQAWLFLKDVSLMLRLSKEYQEQEKRSEDNE